MLDHDPPGSVDRDEDALVRVIDAVGPVHDEAPLAAGAEVERLERAREALRPPPPRETSRIADREEDPLARHVDYARGPELGFGPLAGVRAERRRGQFPDDRRPGLHAPRRHEPVRHVRVLLHEFLDRLGRVAAEEKHRALHRVADRAPEDERPPVREAPRQGEVLGADFPAAGEVVRRHVVEEEKVHRRSPSARAYRAAGGTREWLLRRRAEETTRQCCY